MMIMICLPYFLSRVKKLKFHIKTVDIRVWFTLYRDAKKHGTSFCGKPVCVQCPNGGKTEAPKEMRERNIMSLDSVRNYLLGFRHISEVNILVQKMWISTIPWKIEILDVYHSCT